MSGAPASGEARSRVRTIAGFLDRAGFGAARLRWLKGDASFRRYGRLEGGPHPALVMDAPPAHENLRAWTRIDRHLRALGFSAPEIYTEDAEAGLLVIEDFGDDTFTRLLAGGADEAPLYDLAVDVLTALHALAPSRSAPDWLPAYDEDRLLNEAALFTDWYLPALRGAPTGAGERDEFLALWRTALAPALGAERVLVLRDYHVDNLMRLIGRSGIAACGLLDFQDAVAGHAAYDLVSLLEDARRDLGPGIAERARERYFAARPGLDRDAFIAAGAALSAGRNAKIIGIFTRLWVRDGKPAYLAHIPRVWRLLAQDLRHPDLAQLAAWFDRAVPAEARRAPAPGTAP